MSPFLHTFTSLKWWGLYELSSIAKTSLLESRNLKREEDNFYPPFSWQLLNPYSLIVPVLIDLSRLHDVFLLGFVCRPVPFPAPPLFTFSFHCSSFLHISLLLILRVTLLFFRTFYPSALVLLCSLIAISSLPSLTGSQSLSYQNLSCPV